MCCVEQLQAMRQQLRDDDSWWTDGGDEMTSGRFMSCSVAFLVVFILQWVWILVQVIWDNDRPVWVIAVHHYGLSLCPTFNVAVFAFWRRFDAMPSEEWKFAKNSVSNH